MANPVVCSGCTKPWRFSQELPVCPRCGILPPTARRAPSSSEHRVTRKPISERLRALREADEAAAESDRIEAERVAEAKWAEEQRAARHRELEAKSRALENSLAPVEGAAIVIEPDDLSKECPRCAETIKARAKVCRYCAHEFEPADEAPRERRDARRGRDRGRADVLVYRPSVPNPSPGIAALLSFFFVGAGQIYAGSIGRGLILFFFVPALVVVAFLLVGPLAWVVWLVLWIINIADAAACATSAGEHYRSR